MFSQLLRWRSLSSYPAFCPRILQGQVTISTGNINRTVVDPSGAAVSDAKITITHIGSKRLSKTPFRSGGTVEEVGSSLVWQIFRGFGRAPLSLRIAAHLKIDALAVPSR